MSRAYWKVAGRSRERVCSHCTHSKPIHDRHSLVKLELELELSATQEDGVMMALPACHSYHTEQPMLIRPTQHRLSRLVIVSHQRKCETRTIELAIVLA